VWVKCPGAGVCEGDPSPVGPGCSAV